ncbi:hypothetical protein ACFFRR_006333 [Megaselia abdita]
MDDYIFNEKQSIRKYGSIGNHIRKNEILIRHEIEKSDTLQGISLKYGCSTEQIRRANRLFASDSLFLRQYLLIPVEKSSPYYPKDDRPQSFPSMNFTLNDTPTSSSPASGSSELSLQNEEVIEQHNNRNASCSMESMDTDPPTLSPEEESRKSINDFLDKIDNTIAASKQYVAKSQSSDLLSTNHNDDLFNTTEVERRRNSSANNSGKKYLLHNRHSSSGSYSDTAHLLNLNQGKRVQTSLQRLEKQQDEFFEL